MHRSTKNKDSLLLFDSERHDVNEIIETEAMKNKPLKTDNYLKSMVKRHKTEINTQNYDPLGAKITYRKYLLVRNNMAFLCAIVLFFNLASFAITYYTKEHDAIGNQALMISVMIFKILIVLLYLESIKRWGAYMKKTDRLNQYESIFENEGYVWIVLKAFILFIHPIYWLDGIKVQAFQESFYTEDERYYFFVRDINLYFYLIQFAVLFWVIFVSILDNTQFADTRSQRVCRLFRFDNDIIFIVKCMLSKNGGTFVFLMLISIMFYFSTLFNIAEIGAVLSLEPEQFDTFEEYELAVLNFGLLTTYYNTFWTTMITITTIGYGDMGFRDSLARVIIFFVALVGAVLMPILVVTVSNVLTAPDNEIQALDLYHKVQAKKRLRVKAAYLITYLLKLRLAKKNNDTENALYYNNLVSIHRKEYANQYATYKNMFFITEMDDVSITIEKTQQKYEILRNHFLPFVLEVKEDSQSIKS